MVDLYYGEEKRKTVDPEEYGYVPIKRNIIEEPTPDRKAEILSKIGNTYDNNDPLRLHRSEPSPFSSEEVQQPEK